MLVEFVVENYRSFRDEQRFSLVASADASLPNNLITTEALGNLRLLRSAVIYGANAAGKSNLLDALGFLEQFVQDADTRPPGSPIDVQPFRLDPETIRKPSTFELTVIKDDVRYQYGIMLDRERIHREWVYAFPKRTPQRWLERTLNSDNGETDWHFSRSLRNKQPRLERLARPDVPFLTVAAKFNHPQLTPVFEAITSDINVILGRHQRPDYWTNLTAQLSSGRQLIRKQIRELLLQADLGITDFVHEERPRYTEKDIAAFPSDEIREWMRSESENIIHMRHRTRHSDQGVLLPFEDESDGTRRLFGLGLPMLFSLGLGDTLVVDELDASLHPSIAHWIVEQFHDPERNQENAQLIFNTHDTTLLDTTLFRRDQIWFVEKDDDGASHLYPLLDYSPRRDEALAKGYLRGRYGAIPFITSGELNGIGHAEP